MIQKRAEFTAIDIKPLNKPLIPSIFVNQNLSIENNAIQNTMKVITASQKSADMTVDGDSPRFDLESEIQKHPDSLYVKCFAIKADETNDNGDYFGYNPLKLATPTFVGVPVFTNHKNDDVNEARGKVVHSWWDEEKRGIMIIARVDAEAYPQLARGIKENYIASTSMGCFLGHNRVLMSNGTYCPIVEIQTGDMVVTHKGNIKPVVNLQRHLDKENDNILHIGIRGIKDTIDSTEDHPFYVPSIQKECACGCGKEIGIDHSTKFKNYQNKYLKGHYQKTSAKISDTKNKLTYEWKSARDLRVGDFVCIPRLKSNNHSITHDEAKLIGLFLAEGSYLKYKGEKTAVEFNFSLTEKDELGQSAIDLLKSVFPNENSPKTRIREDRNIFIVRLYGRKVANWFFDNCGEYSHEKRLSSHILSEDNETLSHLIGNFISGDGRLRDVNGSQNYNIWTTSPYLRDQFDTILNKLGITHSTSVLVNGKSSNLRLAAGAESINVDYVGVKTRRPSYSIQIGQSHSAILSDYIPYKSMTKFAKQQYNKKFVTDDFILTPITSISRSYNTEPVYTLQVASDNSFVVEGTAVKNCQVAYSLCSICHNYAEAPDAYCEHVRERKTRVISARNQKCEYHKNGVDDECPICQSTKKKIQKYNLVDKKVFEYNYGIKFIENSFVVNPACSDCGVTEVIDPQAFLSKVATLGETLPRLLKAAASEPLTCTDQSCIKLANADHLKVFDDAMEFLRSGTNKMFKQAGQKEIDDLQQALDLITSVSQAMLSQKDQIDLEFLSDLVKVLSDLQTVSDELNEQGYGRLPSPGEPGQDQNAQSPQQQSDQVPQPQPVAPRVQSGPAGAAGTVTSPMAKNTVDLKKNLEINI